MSGAAMRGETESGREAVAIAAVVAASIAMGASPVFVRFAEVGPSASAFWRVALALPALWLWARLERRAGAPARPDAGDRLAIVVAGVLFAGDLTFWHLAILNTSVANATFLATLAPVWVALFSRLLIGEAVERRALAGLALCLLGALALIGGTMTLAPQRLAGDLYGVAASFFFGLYFLAVRRARRAYGTGRTVFLSSLVTAAVLLAEAFAIGGRLWPGSGAAIASLVALALVSHAGGQGLLAYALGHLPAGFSSLVIFLEVVAAAALGSLVLGEAIGPAQAAGAAAILAGIAVARPRGTPQAASDAGVPR